MRNSIIKIEQTLHGYSQGHHLLGTSAKLSNGSLRIMSILSDLSGPEIDNGFTEYITGYPLIEDGYYALAKTWYAQEMERPGCVWTHTLLIRFTDLSEKFDSLQLINYFRRPEINFNKDDYCNSIEMTYDINNKNKLFNYDNSFLHKYKLLTWSLYNDEKPLIVPSVSNNGYDNLILYIWQCQWLKLRSNFTFCTGSFTNRKIGDKSFDVQITPIALSKSISRSDPKLIILDYDQHINNSPEYPEWVYLVVNETINQTSTIFNDFLNYFGNDFTERKYYSKFAQLYFETEANNHTKSISNFLYVVKSIFNTNDYFLIMETFLSKLYKSMPNRWIVNNDIISIFQELSTIIQNDLIPTNKQQISFQLELLWKTNKNSVKKLFKWLISNDLNQFGEKLLEEYSKLIQPNELGDLTDMDLGACNVLVSLNIKLATYYEIWHKSKDFQCEIIDCIGKNKVSFNSTGKIIETILDNSIENITEQMFKVFDNKLINVFLEWGQKRNNKNDLKLHSWIKICKYSPKTTIEWLASCVNINIEFLILIISVLDPYSPELTQYGLKPWLGLFQQISNKNFDFQLQLILAQFFLPLSLKSRDPIAKDFALFSYYPIDKALASDQFSYEQWRKLENLLPELPWYKAWDKCKRLRMAMEKRGYL